MRLTLWLATEHNRKLDFTNQIDSVMRMDRAIQVMGIDRLGKAIMGFTETDHATTVIDAVASLLRRGSGGQGSENAKDNG
jgi:hypothetical protein